MTDNDEEGWLVKKTRFEAMTIDEHRALCGLVARLIPTLDWRHNGLGVLQAYVWEGKTDEMRVHIWHPALMRPGIEMSGSVHDHRFDMTSQVLYGTIIQYEYDLFEAANGYWQSHEVVHAREALARTGKLDGMLAALPGRYDATVTSKPIEAGVRYHYPRGAFHGTRVRYLTVSVVTKTNQHDVPARILAPFGQPVVHAFGEPMPKDAWIGLLDGASAVLLDKWKTLR